MQSEGGTVQDKSTTREVKEPSYQGIKPERLEIVQELKCSQSIWARARNLQIIATRKELQVE